MKVERKAQGGTSVWIKMYVLDTDVAVDYLRSNDIITEKLKKLNNLFITKLSLAELFFGVYNSRNSGKHYSKLMDFLAGVKILNLDFNACSGFGKIKSNLTKQGKIIGDFDIMIAAVTIANNFALITRNLKHYENIEGLKLMHL